MVTTPNAPLISQQVTPGMTISISSKLYHVESNQKVTSLKGAPPLMRMKLKDLDTNKVVEKSFELGCTVKAVHLSHQKLEYLYREGNDLLFLNVSNLDLVPVSSMVVGDAIQFLKEGVGLTASFYGSTIHSVELPQYLELRVVKVEQENAGPNGRVGTIGGARLATIETGAKIAVPPFIGKDDVIKLDTKSKEYVQRC